jgi:hypothetical protein
MIQCVDQESSSNEGVYYSFALSESVDWELAPPSAFLDQSSIALTNARTTSGEIPARRHTRTRSSPGGTVGGTTGLTINPFSSKYADNACGVDVRRPIIGAWGREARSSSPVGKGEVWVRSGG